MKKNLKSSFISNEILNSIHYLKNNKNYELKIKDCIFHIHLFFNDQNNINIQKFIQYLCEILQLLISLIYHDIKKKNFEIYYYFTNHKKILQKFLQRPYLLTTNEINSGSCQHDLNKKIIHIFRIEDILKTSIHEMIHALELDYYKDNIQIINYYQKKYNISSEIINTNEAYTELFANLLNCYLISKKINTNSKNKYDSFLYLIHLEKEFSNYQSQKILYLSNYQKSKIDINKNTNVLSYFIIRNELFQNLSSFLKFTRLNNNNYLKLNNLNLWSNYLRKHKKIEKKKFRKNKTLKFLSIKMNLFDLSISIS